MTTVGKSLLKISTGLVLLFFLLTAAVAGYFLLNKDKVIRAVIQQLNQKLQVPVEVNTIEVSLKHFPQLSIVFTDVKCNEVTKEAAERLFVAQRIYFNFSLSDVLFSRYSIKEIQLENGEITIKFFENGTNNFQIFKDDSSTSNSPFNIDLLSVKEIVLRYSDFREKIYLTQKIHHALIHLKFGEKNIHSGSWDATNISVKSSDLNFDQEIRHKAEFDILMDKENTLLTLKKITIDGISFALTYSSNPRGKEVEVSAKDQKLFSSNIATIAGKSFFNGLQLKNDKTTATVIGKYNKNKWRFSGNFSTSLKHLSLQNGIYNAEQIFCLGNFDFQNKENYTLILQNLSVKQGSTNLTGNARIHKENKTEIYEGNLSIIGTPAELAALAGISDLTGNGVIKADLEFRQQRKVPLRKETVRIVPEKFTCSINSDNLTLIYGTNRISLPFINWHINNEKLVLKQQAEINGRKLYADLLVSGISNWLLSENEMLTAEGSIYIDQYDENFWKTNQVQTKTPDTFSILYPLKLKLAIEIEKYIANQLVCEQIRASVVKSKKDLLDIENLQMNLLGGTVDFKGHLSIQGSMIQPVILSGTAELKKIDLSRLLQSFNDFDQQELTHKHLYGKLSGNVQFTIPFDENFEADFRKIKATSNVKVTNGRLHNFAPIEALGRFVDLEELKDIRFEELTNKLVIENQLILIPQFVVRSNALDLILEGTHTFDNEIDYKIGLNLGDILYQKRKKKKSINELIFEEDQDGAKLWIRISGNIETPKITPIKAELISQKPSIIRNSKSENQDTLIGKKPIKSPYKFEWDEH